jgi:hypothetical protein
MNGLRRNDDAIESLVGIRKLKQGTHGELREVIKE